MNFFNKEERENSILTNHEKSCIFSKGNGGLSWV